LVNSKVQKTLKSCSTKVFEQTAWKEWTTM